MNRTLPMLLRHLLVPDWLARRAFPKAVLDRIEAAVAESERRHGAEIRFVVEVSLGVLPLWRGQTPRQRAREVFAELGVWDTQANNGVLIYLLLADRDVEILADRGFNGRVTAQAWEAVCQDMEAHFRRGEFEAGALVGIARVEQLLERHFPGGGRGNDALPAGGEGNELPDAPVLR